MAGLGGNQVSHEHLVEGMVQDRELGVRPQGAGQVPAPRACNCSPERAQRAGTNLLLDRASGVPRRLLQHSPGRAHPNAATV